MRSLQNFPDHEASPKVVNKHGIHWNVEKLVKNSIEIIVRQRLIAPRRMILQTWQYAKLKKGLRLFLCSPALDEKWWADSGERFCSVRNVQDLLSDRKNSVRTAIWRTFQWANCIFRIEH